MRGDMCRHYIGAGRPKRCAAGIEYDSVTPQPEEVMGKALRLPCFDRTDDLKNADPGQLEHYKRRGTCPKFERYTEAELAEQEKDMQAAEDRMMKVLPLLAKIRKEHNRDERDWVGVVECPICKGKLHVRHSAYNRHIAGKCETDGCLSWVE